MKIIHNSSDEKAKTQPTRTDEVLPAGNYQAEVVKSTSRQSEYSKSSDNPEGWELSLWLDVQHQGKRFRVFDSIPATHTMRLNEVLAAAGLPALPKNQQQFEESVLEGHTVKIRTYLTKTTGKARVGEYLKGQPQAAKPGKVKVDDSDIPF